MNFKNIKKSLKNKNGFSLVEMIVVLAIVAILAAIAIPIFTNVVSDSVTTANTATVRNIETALELYKIENGGNAPAIAEENGPEAFNSLISELVEKDYLDSSMQDGQPTIKAEGDYVFTYDQSTESIDCIPKDDETTP